MRILFLITMGLMTWSSTLVQSYKILMIIPFGSKSHKNVFNPVAEVLAQKGHEVTIMAPFEETAEVKGIRRLQLKNVENVFLSQSTNFFHGTLDNPKVMENFVKKSVDICHATFSEPEVQDIIKAGRGSRKYDVVVIDQLTNDHVLALGDLMGVPNIYLSSVFLMPWVAWDLNVPSPYSYIPVGLHVVNEPMNFIERAKNGFTSLYFKNMFHGTLFPKFEAVIREHIPDSPPLRELEKNLSLVLLNTNPAIHPRRPSMPYVIEVGCLHCKAPKALPKDLEDFMQESKDDGVIYFSLGSVTQGTYMPEDMKTKVIEAFGKLPQKVLWKYEGDIPNLPKNVKLIKWAPQQDILAHPKVRLFISHGGGLSTQEAPFHACPLLGFPLSADQVGNMGNAMGLGYAKMLDWRTFTAEEFLDTIRKMLDDPQYKEKATQLSRRLQDHPQPPAERAAYWIEFAIRHQGAPYLKSAAEHLNFFQYFFLDIIGVVVGVLILVLVIAFFIVKKLTTVIRRMVRSRNKKIKVKRGKKSD